MVFNSNDCSGPPLIQVWGLTNFNPGFFSLSAVSTPGRTLYLEKPAAFPLILDTFSGSRVSFQGVCVPTTNSTHSLYFPADPVIDLDTLFTPPFSVR